MRLGGAASGRRELQTEGLARLRSVVERELERYAFYCEHLFGQNLSWELKRTNGYHLLGAVQDLGERLLDKALGVKNCSHFIGERLAETNGECDLIGLIESMPAERRHRVDMQQVALEVAANFAKTFRSYIEPHRQQSYDSRDLTRDRANELIELYVIKSCRLYVEGMEKFFYIVALAVRLLGRKLQVAAGQHSSRTQKGLIELYKVWFDFKLCQQYVLAAPSELLR